MPKLEPHDMVVLGTIGSLTASGAEIDSYAIRQHSGLTAAAVRESIQRLRWQGRIAFDRLELAPSEIRWARRTEPKPPVAIASPPRRPAPVARVVVPQVALAAVATAPVLASPVSAPRPVATAPKPAPRTSGNFGWVDRYVSRVQEARSYLNQRGYSVIRASEVRSTWFVTGWSGEFDNDQLVAFADELRARAEA